MDRPTLVHRFIQDVQFPINYPSSELLAPPERLAAAVANPRDTGLADFAREVVELEYDAMLANFTHLEQTSKWIHALKEERLAVFSEEAPRKDGEYGRQREGDYPVEVVRTDRSPANEAWMSWSPAIRTRASEHDSNG
jgi:hypothetical protein